METVARHRGERDSPRAQGAWRRLRVPVRYAFVRLRADGPRNATVAAGIAVGAAMLALTAVGSAAVQDRAVQRALAALGSWTGGLTPH